MRGGTPSSIRLAIAMRQRVYAGQFWSRGVVLAAGVIASLAFALPARAESRIHDGFYAAANLGVGYVKSSGDATLSGMRSITTPVYLWSGATYGTVAYGVGINAEFAYTHAWLLGAALFADIYTDPKGGFHIMPTLGWGAMFPVPYPATGLVLGVGVGYDYWVGSEVSMGVMARMTYAPLQDSGESYTLYAPSLLYTVTYH